MSIVVDTADHLEFVTGLIERGLLVETRAAGLYGHGEGFEAIRRGLEARITADALACGAEPLRFPPVVPRELLAASGYQSAFPHLVGTVFAFDPDLPRAPGEFEPWDELQRITDLALGPAACYPVYPAVAARGALPPGGAFVETGGAWVFRREPSSDPARRQSFHMHELVRIGEPDVVDAWVEEWRDRAVTFLRELGLEVTLAAANDPFFGREGRLLAAHQRAQSLKFEFLVPVTAPEPTAVGSINRHRDQFGKRFGIELAAGASVHSACLGFGHERLVLALLWRHGLDIGRWPSGLRHVLDLSR